MMNDKEPVRDELRMSDLTIEERDVAESRNLNLSLKSFPVEVEFYYEIRCLYENLFKSVPDESIPISFLFKESGHCFMFGFHFVFKAIINFLAYSNLSFGTERILFFIIFILYESPSYLGNICWW